MSSNSQKEMNNLTHDSFIAIKETNYSNENL